MTLIRLETVLLLHSYLLALDGGDPGLRDRGLLESALDRAKNLLAYGNPTVPKVAAAYCHGLCQNHPFVDGNKRVAVVVAATFLETNGFKFAATQEEALRFMLMLAASKVEFDETVVLFEANSSLEPS